MIMDSLLNKEETESIIELFKRQGKKEKEIIELMKKGFEVDEDIVKKIFEQYNRVKILRVAPTSTSRPDDHTWYPGPRYDDKYWPAYRDYLITQRNFNEREISKLDQISTKTISLLSHPGTGAYRDKGLILDYVQPGKTTNYTAVISKAAAVGFKVFIILTGIIEQLRSQTQKRLDLEIVQLNPNNWVSLTVEDADLKPIYNIDALLKDGGKDIKLLLVIKKNTYVLSNLIDWLKSNEESLKRCPVMLIDDESDQASINVSKEEDERFAINRKIIEVMSITKKCSYIAYSTPFANMID